MTAPRKIAIVAALASSLAGCATIDELKSAIAGAEAFTVTQKALDDAREGYNATFLVSAANYRKLGYCASGTKATLAKPCADRATVAKLQAADAVVNVAFNNLQSMITSGNNTGLAASYSTLQYAIQTAEQIAAAAGVK